jgi:hypothetical protein
VNKEQARIGQKLLTSHPFIVGNSSTDHMEWIHSLMHQLFFRYLSYQLDTNFPLLVVHLRFTLSGLWHIIFDFIYVEPTS